jgi:hypothetical protein
MFKIFTVKSIPRLHWSSPTPFNLRPKLLTFFYLNLGLVLFGLGEAMLIASGAGVSPWTVLAQGISSKTDWSVGFSTMIVSFSVLIMWLPLRQKPGMGTILNALIIAFMIDFSLHLLPNPQTLAWQLDGQPWCRPTGWVDDRVADQNRLPYREHTYRDRNHGCLYRLVSGRNGRHWYHHVRLRRWAVCRDRNIIGTQATVN